MAPAFDRNRLFQALERIGADLSARGLFVELAVYRGGALMLQLAWRRGTDDVDAVVREGFDEDDASFTAAGLYPAEGAPGLRTVLATPRYLLAIKLHALQNLDRGDRDLRDVRQLAAHLGIRDVAALHDLQVSIYDEAPPDEASLRFRSVLQDAPR